MANFLVLKGKTWYVRIDVPAYARDFEPIRGKKVLSRSLKTSSYKEAKDRSHKYLAQWKAWFSSAAAASEPSIPSAEEIQSSVIRRDALLRDSKKALAEAAELVGPDRAREHFETELEYLDWEIKAWRSYWFLSDESLEKYRRHGLKKGKVKLKTLDARVSAITKIRAFLESNALEMDEYGVERYLEECSAAANTKRNHMQAGADYWKFLGTQDRGFREKRNPFLGHDIEGRETVKRRHLEPDELRSLYLAAKDKDPVLADLIKLAAYTGARIEELCRLTTEHVISGALKITDAKTTAGNREVPIHARISKLVKGLKEGSVDGYLIHSTAKNKYGIRSDVLSKRFGSLRTRLGFGPEVVFHSIRKTFTTLLEQAGVAENITADIVGHEKKTMTYGVYSGGASMEQKKAAIKLVRLNLD